MGKSITDYTIESRIQCACHIIATTDLTLSEIAYECGYESQALFIKQFKEAKDMLPSQYQKQCYQKRNNIELGM